MWARGYCLKEGDKNILEAALHMVSIDISTERWITEKDEELAVLQK